MKLIIPTLILTLTACTDTHSACEIFTWTDSSGAACADFEDDCFIECVPLKDEDTRVGDTLRELLEVVDNDNCDVDYKYSSVESEFYKAKSIAAAKKEDLIIRTKALLKELDD